MPGKKPQLTPLQSRKQALLKECDRNREQFFEEWHELKDEVQHLLKPTRKAGALVSSVATAETVFPLLRQFWPHKKCRNGTGSGVRGRIVPALLGGAKVGMTLWTLFRHRRKN